MFYICGKPFSYEAKGNFYIRVIEHFLFTKRKIGHKTCNGQFIGFA